LLLVIIATVVLYVNKIPLISLFETEKKTDSKIVPILTQ